MKVSVGHRSRQYRRQTSRPCPYDLRRRVLVNNFLKDSNTPPKCPSPVLNSTLKRSISVVHEVDEDEDEFNTESDSDPSLEEDSTTTDLNRTFCGDSSDDDIPTTVVDALESLKTDDIATTNASDFDDEDLNQFSPETTEFLYLMSRRLRISESQKLRQPCRRSMRSHSKLHKARSSKIKAETRSSSSLNSEKSSEATSKAKDLFPLRSYPTFDCLNEVFECNEKTMKKTAMFLRKRMNSLSNRGVAKISVSTKSPQRSSSLRQSLRSIFKQKKTDNLEISNFCPNHETSSTENTSEPSTNLGQKLKRRNSIVSRLMNSVRKGSTRVITEVESRPRTRASRSKSFSYKSFPQLPKLRHRSASFNLKRNSTSEFH